MQVELQGRDEVEQKLLSVLETHAVLELLGFHRSDSAPRHSDSAVVTPTWVLYQSASDVAPHAAALVAIIAQVLLGDVVLAYILVTSLA